MWEQAGELHLRMFVQHLKTAPLERRTFIPCRSVAATYVCTWIESGPEGGIVPSIPAQLMLQPTNFTLGERRATKGSVQCIRPRT